MLLREKNNLQNIYYDICEDIKCTSVYVNNVYISLEKYLKNGHQNHNTGCLTSLGLYGKQIDFQFLYSVLRCYK